MNRTMLLLNALVIGGSLALTIGAGLLLGPPLGPMVGAGLLLGILGAALALAVRGVMVEVRWDQDGVSVTAVGFRRALALQGTVSLPWSDLTSAQAVEAGTVRLGARLPGTALPGVLTAGSYGTGDGRTFAWFRRRSSRCLLLTARGGPYRRVLVELPDPEGRAAEIRAAAPAGTLQPASTSSSRS